MTPSLRTGKGRHDRTEAALPEVPAAAPCRSLQARFRSLGTQMGAHIHQRDAAADAESAKFVPLYRPRLGRAGMRPAQVPRWMTGHFSPFPYWPQVSGLAGTTPRVSSSAASNSWVLSCTVRRTVVSVVVVVFHRLANGSWTVRINGGAFGKSARRLPTRYR